MFHIVFGFIDAVNKATAGTAVCGGMQDSGGAGAGAGAAAGNSAAVMLLLDVVLDLVIGVLVLLLLLVGTCPPLGPPRLVRHVLPVPFVTFVNLW